MKKILIVDDEQDTASVFQIALKQAGYDVTVTNNGQGALSTVKTAYFDLILLDQMMPDMSGNDVLVTLKQDPVLSKIPVAILSNFSHDEMVNDALSKGATDYILKYQVSNEDLVHKVKELIGE